MSNPMLDLLMKDVRAVYDVVPADGPILELELERILKSRGLGKFFTLDLELLTSFEVLNADNMKDDEGYLWAAYSRTGQSPDALLAAIQREYETIPEAGFVMAAEYFSTDDEQQRVVRDALCDARAISSIFVRAGGESSREAWIRGFVDKGASR